MTLRTPSETSGYPAKRGRYPLVVGIRPALSVTTVARQGAIKPIFPGPLTGDARVAHMILHAQADMDRADLVVFQGPPPRSGPEPGCEEAAGLRVGLRLHCHRHSIPYAIVPPHAIKTYATGRPTAERGAVRTAVADLWCKRTGGPARYALAEAFLLAEMGMDWTGWPMRVLLDRQRDALRAVTWPTGLTADWWA